MKQQSQRFSAFSAVKIKIYVITFFIIVSILTLSCSKEKPTEKPFIWSGAVPAAVLRTGELPIWFQFTEEGPVHIDSVFSAGYSHTVPPWPHALHIRFLTERDGELVMIVNGDGFLKASPNEAGEILLYRFPFEEYFKQYTAGGFVFYRDQPAVLLYLDNRFWDNSSPVPMPQVWSFNMESNTVFPLEIPALKFFPEEEGWDADTLRLASDGLFYYRAAKRSGPEPEIRMFRTADLAQRGEEISVEVFFNSAPRRTEINHPLLPPLPEGFVYTEIGRTGNSLFAAWEEQEDFSIASAGFMVIKR